MHLASVPFALVFPDTEATPLFAGAAVLLALWSVGTGAMGAGTRAPAEGGHRRELKTVS
jgi:hypothetical protein